MLPHFRSQINLTLLAHQTAREEPQLLNGVWNHLGRGVRHGMARMGAKEGRNHRSRVGVSVAAKTRL